jgi:hypothetical protein
VGLLQEAEGTGEEIGGTFGEVPGFGIQTLEAITPLAGGGKIAAKVTGTKTAGGLVKQAGAQAGSSVGKAAAQGAGEALSATEKFALKIMINSFLILAGIALIVYGVMVMVRPAAQAAIP